MVTPTQHHNYQLLVPLTLSLTLSLTHSLTHFLSHSLSGVCVCVYRLTLQLPSRSLANKSSLVPSPPPPNDITQSHHPSVPSVPTSLSGSLSIFLTNPQKHTHTQLI